jgi:polyhydroxyalkanoate synthase
MTTPPPDSAPEIAAALDQLLTQAATGPVRRLLPARSLARFARALAGQPRQVGAQAGSLAAELARIARGTSALAPAPRDRRFADPAWTGNPFLHRVLQAYLAAGTGLLDLVEGVAGDPAGDPAGGQDARGARLDWRDAGRLRFAAANLVDALAPSNNPLLAPAAWKAVIDTGGGSVLSGTRHLLSDLASAPRVPTMVRPDAYTIGTDLVTTPGAVVLRTPVFELIQYQPATGTVRELPVLIVPPTINKYYILDLAPGRSLVEYLVGQGQQVFVVSWRNPDARHAAWGFDSYVQSILDAMDTAARICRTRAVHLLSACSGGILSGLAAAGGGAPRPPSAGPAGPAAPDIPDPVPGTGAAGQSGSGPELASLGLLVTMLDQSRADAVGAFVDEATAEAAVAASARQGYLDGRKLAEVFAWLRPNDLIWNYWVNNYLQGRDPARFDILFWNADSTRMTAGLHRDFVRAALDNSVVKPGALTVLGNEIDLAQVEVDCYAVAGIADHICPWQSCYRGSQVLGGKTRFVLSKGGHIAALVNPVGIAKSSYQASDDIRAEAADWQGTTPARQGSWWPDYDSWLAARSGALVPAPAALGADGFRVLEPAPGSYVRAT